MNNKRNFYLAEIGVSVALSVILSYVSIYKLPQGGSVTLEMLPIFFISFRYGVKSGILTGALSGILQLIYGATIVNIFQLILDYPLAFALVGTAGLFRKVNVQGYNLKFVIAGIILGTFLRLFSHVISGVVFFAEYAPTGMNVWLYSLVYNGSFLVLQLIANLILVPIILKRIK